MCTQNIVAIKQLSSNSFIVEEEAMVWEPFLHRRTRRILPSTGNIQMHVSDVEKQLSTIWHHDNHCNYNAPFNTWNLSFLIQYTFFVNKFCNRVSLVYTVHTTWWCCLCIFLNVILPTQCCLLCKTHLPLIVPIIPPREEPKLFTWQTERLYTKMSWLPFPNDKRRVFFWQKRSATKSPPRKKNRDHKS